jgi:chemotaxis protein CheD
MSASAAARKPIAASPVRDSWAEKSTHGASGRRYFDSRLGSSVTRILPGDFCVTDEDIGLVTTLGSCVSACMRDPESKVGGINHFMLPESEMSGPNITSARYGGYAMELLINELLKRGAHRDRLEAKVFGGGNVLPGFATSDVGGRNARFVHEYLDNERIPVLSEDLGGINPRKIIYFPVTGRVLVMRLAAALNRAELDAERLYQESLRGRPTTGEVELFE